MRFDQLKSLSRSSTGGPEEFADHVQGEGCGDLGDEVDLARDLVEEVVADVADVLLEGADRARGEAPVHQGAPSCVLGRVLVEHHEALQRDLVLLQLVEEGEPAVGGEELGVARHVDDVVVAGDGPETRVALVPVDRGVRAQPGELGVGRSSGRV
ncbi:hypothetical protein GCM10020001_029550 [Nonomuraea salmonea]